jgi:ATP-binding cassette subfamily C (CFTR/MRP) protein 10
MQCLKGRIFVQRDVAYVPQQPWILNDTVWRNIVFSSPYDPERYGRTVSACALETDISQFAGGHDAEIVCLLHY